jgi:hypothetical protein
MPMTILARVKGGKSRVFWVKSTRYLPISRICNEIGLMIPFMKWNRGFQPKFYAPRYDHIELFIGSEVVIFYKGCIEALFQSLAAFEGEGWKISEERTAFPASSSLKRRYRI